jgi:hypothetical protein
MASSPHPVAGTLIAGAIVALAVLLAGIAGGPSAARADTSLTVVELFTSQGCSSCPPADALLGELAANRDILALSEHVDYWDHLGWRDPFAQARFTQRQRAYARRLDLRHVYTPQMVINGAVDVPGSRRGAVLGAIASAPKLAPLSIRLDVSDPGQRRVTIGPDVAQVMSPAAADVWYVTFERHHSTAVARGENGGRALENHNVVRRLERIGGWTGKAVTLTLPTDAQGDGAAVLVQAEDGGPILAARRIDPPDG